MPCPFPIPSRHDLQSGDLLFPKNPNHSLVAAVPDLAQLFRDAGGHAGHNKLNLQALMASSRADDKPLQAYLSALQARIQNTFGAEVLVALSLLDLPLLIYVYRLLFEEVTDQLGPLVRDINLSFGHVAMLFQESEEWFVVEAGCTDYSHYRVSIAPYWDPDDANRPLGQARGWAQRRANLGQYTWTARHTNYRLEKLPEMLAECKNWLSVPYGILEPGMMKNPDRIYCAELMLRAFDRVELEIDQEQNWAWVMKRIAALDPNVSEMLLPILNGILPEFPLLTPGMIYEGKLMTTKPFTPLDAAGNKLVYMS